ncbi:hypothetical protein [Roseomonas indoligenes]|uniref:Uncharacterized protein n=1 Tax=Roseomonas indoligenes TaxID=2820811 RepID=A0A940MYF5_9PROT|nr:hypothetical protein [Pararoseomonas indoligenes]MBP0492736.1 hypothetical protein [Pararoseomonas indoligenes]
MRPPETPGLLIAMIAVLGLGLFVAFGLGFGGFGMAHFLGYLMIAIAVGAFGLLRRRR